MPVHEADAQQPTGQLVEPRLHRHREFLNRALLTDEYEYIPFALIIVFSILALPAARGIYMLSLHRNGLVLPIVGVALVTLVAVCAVGLVLMAYWSAFSDSDRIEPFALGAIALLGSITLSIEALSGLSWLLWDRNASDSTTGSMLSLWDFERLYIWNLVDGIPLLDITDAFSWQRPDIPSSPILGSFLVLFRVIVLVPLLGLGAIGIRASQSIAQRQMAKERGPKLQRDGVGDIILLTGFVVLIASLLLVVPFLANILLEQDSSWPRYWLHSFSGSSIDIPLIEYTVNPTWTPEIVDVLLLALLIYLAFWLAVYVCFFYADTIISEHPGFLTILVTAAFAFAMVIGLSQALAMTLTIIHNLGLIESIGPDGDVDQFPASFQYLLWNAAKVAPLVDITSTADWSLSDVNRDNWHAFSSILLRAAMVAVVFWPIGLLMNDMRSVSTTAGSEKG